MNNFLFSDENVNQELDTTKDILINSGITTYSPGQRHQVHSKRVSCLEGSWRWKEKEEEMIAR